MIIWRGNGFLVIVTIFLTSLVANLATSAHFGVTYWDANGWPFASALLVAGGLIWILAAALDKRPKRVLIDAETKERIEICNSGEFFFLPMRWWGLLVSALGLLVLLTGWAPG
jgi:hypothetical protein